jgi:hypothetical protein
LAHTVGGRVGFGAADAAGREVDGDPVRAAPEFPDITSSGTKIPAAITMAIPKARRNRPVLLWDENLAITQLQLPIHFRP